MSMSLICLDRAAAYASEHAISAAHKVCALQGVVVVDIRAEEQHTPQAHVGRIIRGQIGTLHLGASLKAVSVDCVFIIQA